MNLTLEKQLKFEIGKNYQLFPHCSLYPFSTTYEGVINGRHAFLTRLGEERISSWREVERDIRIWEDGSIHFLGRSLVVHTKGSEQYEKAKELLIKSDNWKE